MKINKNINSYQLNEKEITLLYERGYINGCGGKGGINFSKIISDNIKALEGYISDSADELFEILDTVICGEHDIDFSRGGNRLHFYIANIKFGYKLIKLLKFASKSGKLLMFVISVGMLNKYGKKYFKWGKRKTLHDLLK